MPWTLTSLIAFLVISYVQAVVAQAEAPVEYAISPDRTELFISIPEKKESYYFNNNAKRLSYTYKIPGKWKPSQESALLVSEDGRAFVGVMLYSTKELEGYEGNDLLTRTSNLITKNYQQKIGKSPASKKLVSFSSPRSGTMKWSASWHSVGKDGRPVELRTDKVLWEISPGWVAQITVNGTSDDDGLARGILETLNATSKPEGYWPFIRRHFPKVPGS